MNQNSGYRSNAYPPPQGHYPPQGQYQPQRQYTPQRSMMSPPSLPPQPPQPRKKNHTAVWIILAVILISGGISAFIGANRYQQQKAECWCDYLCLCR